MIIETNDGVEVAIQISAGAPGPSGAQGIPGSAGLLSATADAALSGHSVVLLTSTGADLASSATLSHMNRVVGITLGAAVMGDAVSILTSGSITEPGWSWNTALPIFLSQSGGLTQTVPTVGAGDAFSQVVAMPTSATSILVTVNPDPIRLV